LTLAEWKVPLFDLDLGEEEYQSVKGVLTSNWLTMGQVTRDFESAFADYLGVKHAVAVSSATAAMHLAHIALGLERGDEVICPSLTFVATANAISYTGATAVFAEIGGLDELTISPDDMESKIGKRTKGIVAMHYAGFPCNMDRIMEIARNRNLFVVEDAAHAPGAEYSSKLKARSSKQEVDESTVTPNDGQRTTDDRQRTTDNGRQTTDNGQRTMNDGQRTTDDRCAHKVGTIGDVGCFSFFGNKNMTTAEGGMVVTNRDDLAEKIEIARSHGMTSMTWDRYKSSHDFSYDVVGPGFNYRIDDLRSSLGLVQLKKLDRNNGRRGSSWMIYREKLGSIEEIKVPFSSFSGMSSHHICPILLSEKIDRKDFMEYLRENGIQTSIHYPPIHLFSYYKKMMPSDTHLPLTEYVGGREVTLPLYPTMEEQHIDYVVDTIKEYLTVHS
jgi:dTDP-4-amino-4,6-dideoxygalactose transaminase